MRTNVHTVVKAGQDAEPCRISLHFFDINIADSADQFLLSLCPYESVPRHPSFPSWISTPRASARISVKYFTFGVCAWPAL